MKIGIMSMQRIYNYGSFMQSYALKKMIESLGHEVVFIDIQPGEQIVPLDKNAQAKRMIRKLDRHILKRIEHYLMIKKNKSVFPNVLASELNVSETNINEKCDTLVIGSDEVFNCLQAGKPFGFAPCLFGQYEYADKVISYAASFGHTTLGELKKYGVDQRIGKYFHSFSAISVRDQNSFNIVQNVSGITPVVHVDPAIVGDYDDRVIAPKDKDYIAVYAYSNRFSDPEEINAIKAFAKKRGLKTIGVGMFQMWCDKNVMGTPFEMVGYIKYADYVVTDTFHGTVFSIKFHRRFATFIRPSNRNKLEDLLSRFELANHMVSSPAMLEDVLQKSIDTVFIDNRIALLRKESIEYLKDNL